MASVASVIVILLAGFGRVVCSCPRLAAPRAEARSRPLRTARPSILVPASRRSMTKGLRRVTRNLVVVVGAVFALVIVGMALFAGILAPHPPDEQNFDLIEARPGRSEE